MSTARPGLNLAAVGSTETERDGPVEEYDIDAVDV